MAKDPALLWYPNDYLGGTMGMTFEQKGAYVELLMLQFNRGHMTYHMIGQTLGQNGGQIWDTIKEKFETDPQGLFFNRRLEDEQNKRKSYVASRLNNKKGKNQFTLTKEKRGHMTSHTTGRMEDENVNENLNVIKEKRVKGKKDEPLFKDEPGDNLMYPFSSERFKSAWAEWKEYKWSQHKEKYKTAKTEQVAINKLAKDADYNELTAISMIETSIASCWKGLFPEKKAQNSKKALMKNIIAHPEDVEWSR